MAKVIQSEYQIVAEPWWAQGKGALIGLGAGFSWWVITSLLKRYVVEPLACRDLSTASACVDSFGVAGSIAALIVALAGMYVLVRAVQPRPIVIAAASAILLWDLGSLMAGLSWWVTLLWAVPIYTIAYALFGLTARLRSIVVSILVSLILIVGIRLLLTL